MHVLQHVESPVSTHDEREEEDKVLVSLDRYIHSWLVLVSFPTSYIIIYLPALEYTIGSL